MFRGTVHGVKSKRREVKISCTAVSVLCFSTIALYYSTHSLTIAVISKKFCIVTVQS